MRNATKQDVLIGIGKLEKLAKAYGSTAKTLQKLARSLRRITEGVGAQQPATAASTSLPGPKKAPSKAKANQPQRRKGMSAAARKKLSDMAKARWAEKKAAQSRPNGKGKPVVVGEATGARVA